MRKFLPSPQKVLSAVPSRLIRYNKYIKSDNILSLFFSKNLFENNGKMKSWEDFREKLELNDNKKFCWSQIIHTTPCTWKEMFSKCGNNISNLLINEHDLIENHQIFC